MKTEILEKLLEYINQTKDFFLKETPEVIVEVLTYYKFKNWLDLGFLMMAFFILAAVCVYYFKYPIYDRPETLSLESTFGRMMPIFLMIPCSIGILTTIQELIKLHVTPKYFLLHLIMNWKSGQ